MLSPSWIVPSAMVVVLAALRVGVMRPLVGFVTFLLLWVAWGALEVVLAYRALRGGDGWLAHAVLALLLIGSLLIAGARSRKPPIHDVTTAPDDAPELVHAAALPENAGRDLSYPNGADDTPEIQRRAYPDLAPLHLPTARGDAQQQALEAARGLGWRITWSDPQRRGFEAVATTTVFRFADDVAVRIVDAPDGGSIVDVRSTSRVGRGDLGANAARIRRFLDRLLASVAGPE